MSKEKETVKLEYVEEIPKAEKVRKSEYDKILEDFVKSNKQFAKIATTKKTKGMYSSLFNRIKAKKLPVKVRTRGNVLYLERT